VEVLVSVFLQFTDVCLSDGGLSPYFSNKEEFQEQPLRLFLFYCITKLY